MARKNISLNQPHIDWVNENNINLSGFVQSKIDEERRQEHWNTDTIIHDPGVELGENIENNHETIIYNRFQHQYNPSWITTGATIPPESNAISRQLSERRELGDTVIRITPLCEQSTVRPDTGTRIHIDANSKLNPLHISPVSQSLEDVPVQFKRLHKQYIHSFFTTFCSLQGRQLPKHESNVLMKAIKPAYQKRGIHLSDPSTYDNPSPTIQDDLLPILEIMASKSDDNSPQLRNSTEQNSDPLTPSYPENEREVATKLLLTLQPLIEGDSVGNLGGESALDVNKDEVTQITISGTYSESVGLMVNLILSTVYERMKAPDTNTVIVVDNARYTAVNEDCGEYIESAIRYARHYGISVQLNFKSIAELLQTQNTKGILDQTSHKLLFDSENIPDAGKDMLGLTDIQREHLTTGILRNTNTDTSIKTHGNCALHIAGSGWYPLRTQLMNPEN